ncbi:integrase core domain-containing protein [Actinomadura mexicana]|uniref:integrase core domain-containing protein n=1 Tax=Actinomadura mexicana TaxID=134959 RepID=UPI000B792F2C
MGTVGDCYDNAMMESFWGTMQLELLDTRNWRTKADLAAAVFEWIECSYNPFRAQPRNAQSGGVRGTTPRLVHDHLPHLTPAVRAAGEPQRGHHARQTWPAPHGRAVRLLSPHVYDVITTDPHEDRGRSVRAADAFSFQQATGHHITRHLWANHPKASRARWRLPLSGLCCPVPCHRRRTIFGL